MKKTFLFACAAIAASLSLTSCSDEVDMFEKAGKTATIDLNITNDDAMVTRAEQTVTDASTWQVQVSPAAAEGASAGETAQVTWKAANALTESFKAGGYKIEVRNYAGEDACYSANSSRGAAYYTGSVDKKLVKGSNTVEINCGQAQNCRVKVSLSGLSGIGITNPSITLVQTNRGVACPALTDDQIGYFKTGTDITYTLTYTYGNDTKTTTAATISTPAAHTEYSIVATTNSNGTINLSIKYNDAFDQGNQSNITIDAATGAEANS